MDGKIPREEPSCRRLRRWLILFGVATSVWLAVSSPSSAWQRNINGRGESQDMGKAVAVDGVGDVVAAGEIASAERRDFAVVKLAGATGSERWRRVLTGKADAGGEANAVAVDGRGDIVAAGDVGGLARFPGQFAVIKLKGTNGEELWRRIITGEAARTSGHATAVVVDSAGSVVVLGHTASGFNSEAVVVKLDGNSGAEIWRRYLFCRDPGGVRIALDAGGAVVAAGRGCPIGTPPGSRPFSVVKLEGSSGAERWRYTLDIREGTAHAVAVDGSGDVVATGDTASDRTGGDFVVVKVDGQSGTERWRRTVGAPLGGVGDALAIDRAGNVLAGGVIEVVPGIKTALGVVPDITQPRTATVVKLDGNTGAELWRRPVVGTERSRKIPVAGVAIVAEIVAVTVDAANDMLVGAQTLNGRAGSDFTVIKLDGRSGTERWRRIISGRPEGGGPDRVAQVVTDAAGNVVVVGRTSAGAAPALPLVANTDFTVAKLRGRDGRLHGEGRVEGAGR